MKHILKKEISSGVPRPDSSCGSDTDPGRPDCSIHDLDEYVQPIEIPGIQGLFGSINYGRDGDPTTVREAARCYAQDAGMPAAAGRTAADIADRMELCMDNGGADYHMLAVTCTPVCPEDFSDLVVPELQRRGRYLTAYTGSTLRENLLTY